MLPSRQWFQANSFLLLLGAVLVLAAAAPGLADEDGPVPLALLKRIGVFWIFLNQGVSLSLGELGRGLLRPRLHLWVQSCVYLLFPGLTALWLILGEALGMHPDLQAGFWYLALLPTTISSAIALTAVAGGTVSAALFNCTLSSFLAVLWVPGFSVLLLGTDGANGGGGVDLVGPMLVRVSLAILLPLALGQVLRRWLSPLFEPRKKLIRRTNTGVILFLVWSAFAQGFLEQVWTRVGGGDWALLAAGVIVLLASISFLAWAGSGWLRLEPALRKVALFCGSQKSLAVGLPLSVAVFEGSPRDLGILLLPLLLYHPLQLALGGAIASRWANHVDEKEP